MRGHAHVPSWLSALTDPVAGSALAVLHAQPGRDWTIPSLAAAIGVSRATLARRFPVQVGYTPAAYLTRWRMDLAAVRLRDTDDTVGTIARSLGYTSEYAFNRAFTRARRIPPAATAPSRVRRVSAPVSSVITAATPKDRIGRGHPAGRGKADGVPDRRPRRGPPGHVPGG